ncbi:MAG TPA: Uma2 family endonuclease [Chthonomonadaceae bacterium]|nr:Uma2 family endonuclease [Chthonomonadaceae bacterium]
MPHLIEQPLEAPLAGPKRIRWTRDQCTMIATAGILTGRYELIEGEIYSKMGQNAPHAYVVKAVMVWLAHIFGLDYVRDQLPITVGGENAEHNEPEPDVVVTTLPYTAFSQRHPQPAEIRLLVEVSDSTLAFDLNTKSRVYAGEGVTDYWIVDVSARRLLVMRAPGPAGYASTVAFSEDERCAPLADPEAAVLVADLLPPL